MIRNLVLDPKPVVPESCRRKPALHVRTWGVSHPGLVRAQNEDVFVIAEIARSFLVRQSNAPLAAESLSQNRGYVCIVADGVGGNEAGEVASRLCLDSIEQYLLNQFRRERVGRRDSSSFTLQELQTALQQADDRLFAAVEQHPEWWGMASTLTLVLISGRRGLVAHAGDSRCYLLRRGALTPITTDHTFAADLARSGVISKEQQQTHPWRHILTNVLGGHEPGVRVELHEVELEPQDGLLLCSDGLTDVVSSDELTRIFSQHLDPQAACGACLEAALKAGAPDNVTVVVAFCQDPDVSGDTPP